MGEKGIKIRWGGGGLACCTGEHYPRPTQALFEVLCPNLMRGKARFDCRKRKMREKERVIQGEEKELRRRGHIYVGLNWIMIFLIGEKLLWQAAHKETPCQSKVKSRGVGQYLYLFWAADILEEGEVFYVTNTADSANRSLSIWGLTTTTMHSHNALQLFPSSLQWKQ